jgi:hypothetical protein
MKPKPAQKQPTALAPRQCGRGVPAGTPYPGHGLHVRIARPENTPQPPGDDRRCAAVVLEAGPQSASRQGWRRSSLSARSHSPAGRSTFGRLLI